MRGRRWTERSARDAAHAPSPRGPAAQPTRLPTSLPTVSSWELRWSPSTRVRAKRARTPARAHGPVRCPRSRWSMRLVPVTASQPTDHRAARRFGTRCIAPPRRLRSARAPSRVPATRTGSLTAISATSVSRLATSARVTERTDSSPLHPRHAHPRRSRSRSPRCNHCPPTGSAAAATTRTAPNP